MRRNFKVIWVIFSFVLFLAGFLCGDEFQFSILGGLNRHLEYGTEKDYQPGVNHFPVTPAHNSRSLYLAAEYYFSRHFGIAYDGRISFSTDVRLTDPGDGDTLDFRTFQHTTHTLDVLFRIPLKRFQLYLTAGGGFDRAAAHDETYETEYGYLIEYIAPIEEENFDPVLQAGMGILFPLGRAIGLRLDVRYALIFNDPHNIKTLSLAAGFFLRFEENQH